MGDSGVEVSDPGRAPFEIIEAVQAMTRRARMPDGTGSLEAPTIEAVLVRLSQDAWNPDVRHE